MLSQGVSSQDRAQIQNFNIGYLAKLFSYCTTIWSACVTFHVSQVDKIIVQYLAIKLRLIFLIEILSLSTISTRNTLLKTCLFWYQVSYARRHEISQPCTIVHTNYILSCIVIVFIAPEWEIVCMKKRLVDCYRDTQMFSRIFLTLVTHSYSNQINIVMNMF